jgi:hypothetical protein
MEEEEPNNSPVPEEPVSWSRYVYVLNDPVD